MKITPFTSQNFQELSQLDKIEYLLRENAVTKNIKKSFPALEISAILVILAYRAIHNLLFVAAFGLDSSTTPLINLFSMFCNTLIVIFVISFIARIMIYFQKHRQLSELHDEFLDRIQVSLEIVKSKRKK
jgi:H+/gluconate symporter-like permease